MSAAIANKSSEESSESSSTDDSAGPIWPSLNTKAPHTMLMCIMIIVCGVYCVCII